jgi:hypothetical protein
VITGHPNRHDRNNGTATEEWSFLCSPCQDVISSQANSVLCGSTLKLYDSTDRGIICFAKTGMMEDFCKKSVVMSLKGPGAKNDSKPLVVM